MFGEDPAFTFFLVAGFSLSLVNAMLVHRRFLKYILRTLAVRSSDTRTKDFVYSVVYVNNIVAGEIESSKVNRS